MITRRKLLAGGALFSAVGLYAHQRGLRYPRLSFEHNATSSTLSSTQFELHFKDCIAVNGNTLRAIAPEPSISIQSVNGDVSFDLLNIAGNAVLSFDSPSSGDIFEEIDGTRRTIHIQKMSRNEVNLKWTLPVSDGFKFAVMGDTGGGSELAWTLKRAVELDAQFLLHLGDFNYTDGEYQQAIEHFNAAELPCYVTIGNHDFHDNGLIYQQFLQQIGPMNHAFELAGTRFINVDTAADFWPAQSGQRGNLLNSLAQQPFSGDQLLFTHRPLKDPRPHDDHEIGGIGEIDWLVKQSHKIGISTALCGHVHHSAELDCQGLTQLTIGEGLGHEDLVLQNPVAKIMIASVEPGKKLSHQWVDLNMPWSEHQSPTHMEKLKRDGRRRQIEWFKALPQQSKKT